MELDHIETDGCHRVGNPLRKLIDEQAHRRHPGGQSPPKAASGIGIEGSGAARVEDETHRIDTETDRLVDIGGADQATEFDAGSGHGGGQAGGRSARSGHRAR